MSCDMLTVDTIATYKLTPPGNLGAKIHKRDHIIYGRVSKIAFDDLTRPRATIPWSDTNLREDGNAIRALTSPRPEISRSELRRRSTTSDVAIRPSAATATAASSVNVAGEHRQPTEDRLLDGRA